MSEKKEVNAEVILAPQLGSDQITLEKSRIDIRRYTVLEDLQEMVFHAWSQNVPKAHGGELLRNFSIDLLNLKISDKGLGRKQNLLAIAGSKGTPILRQIDTRSWTQRHLTMRDEEKAKREGKIEMEIGQ